MELTACKFTHDSGPFLGKILLCQYLMFLFLSRFRWAKCCLEQIAFLRNDKAIRQALHSLPPNLEESYEAILTRISEDDRHLAIRVFEWLVCSIRPMTIEEVVEGVSIEFGDTTLDLSSKLNDVEDILDICGGLVSLTNDTRILGLAHFSVKEYLVSERIAGGPASSYQIDPRVTHVELAKFCLTYISFEDFDFGPCDTNNELKCRFERYPLLEYAAHNWQKHARDGGGEGDDDELISMIEEFLNPLSCASIYLSWAQAYHTESSEPSLDYNAYSRCSSLVSAQIGGFCTPLYSGFSRQPNCGCREVVKS